MKTANFNGLLAVSDPTASSDRNVHSSPLGDISTLLQTFRYAVSKEREDIDGAPCVVLEGRVTGWLPYLTVGNNEELIDKLWLDVSRGLAIRKRELISGKRIIEIRNSQFQEVHVGVWLPRHSRTTMFALAGESDRVRGRPLSTREMALRSYVINQTPSILFDLLKKNRVARVPPRAYHWRLGRSDARFVGTEEGWVLRGVGRRVELTTGDPPRLVSIVVDKPEATFRYNVAKNHLSVSRSELRAPTHTYTTIVHRDEISRHLEEWTALLASNMESRNGRDTERIAYIQPTDPLHGGDWPIHRLLAAELLQPGGDGFRERTFWWDQESGYCVSHTCGCKVAKHGDLLIDYPDPQGFSEKLFVLEIGADTETTVSDPPLERYIEQTVRSSASIERDGVRGR